MVNHRAQRVYEFGPFRMDVTERLLLRNGESVPLTPKSFDILRLLIQNSGRLLKKDELMNEVWPEVFVEEANVDRHISTLRKALGESNNKQRYIETVSKGGYRFSAAVKNQPQSGKKRIKSIAVLPLVDAGGTASTEYLSDGITESIIYNLSQLPHIHVLARNTVFRYKGEDTESLRVGHELQVDVVLSGRVLQVAHRLIIRVELVDVATGWQIWGEQYDQPTANILAVQQEISQAVSEQLRFKLGGERKRLGVKQQTVNNEAYRAYLKGRYYLGKRTVEGIRMSLDFFQQAVEIDPTYALAYVGIADGYILLTSYGTLAPKDSFPKVKKAARKALKIDANLAEARTTIGFTKTFERDWAGAEKEFKRAIKINVNYPSAHHWYSSYLQIIGRFDEAFRELRHACRLDPLSLIFNSSMASLHYCVRQYDLAIAQALETLKLDPYFFHANAILGAAYAQKGMFKEAIASLQKAINISLTPEGVALLGHTYATAGKKRDAQRLLNQLQELSEQRHVESTCMAIIYAGLMDKKKAFEWLEKAYNERDELLALLAFNPIFDNLRADSEFSDLLRRMGLSGAVL